VDYISVPLIWFTVLKQDNQPDVFETPDVDENKDQNGQDAVSL
jgi:hypothetical protein